MDKQYLENAKFDVKIKTTADASGRMVKVNKKGLSYHEALELCENVKKWE